MIFGIGQVQTFAGSVYGEMGHASESEWQLEETWGNRELTLSLKRSGKEPLGTDQERAFQQLTAQLASSWRTVGLLDHIHVRSTSDDQSVPPLNLSLLRKEQASAP